MKAVILAAGKGTRFRPLTCDLPTPMIPVVRKPALEAIVEHLRCHRLRPGRHQHQLSWRLRSRTISGTKVTSESSCCAATPWWTSISAPRCDFAQESAR
jgi:hypothetical protein